MANTSEIEARDTRFRELRNNKPQPGDVLKSEDGTPIMITVQGTPDNYTLLVNARIDEECTGWYLTKENQQYCLKVLILPYAQKILIEQNGGVMRIFITELRVVRYSRAGTALLCELVSSKAKPKEDK